MDIVQVNALIQASSINPEDTKWSQTPQLVAFAAIAVYYGKLTNWQPTEKISSETKEKLAKLARALNIEKVAYQTFIVHLRRMVRKFCDDFSDHEEFREVINADTEINALNGMLNIMKNLNIFTAGHMRTWAGSEGIEGLQLKKHRNEDRAW
ncbi:hypothetical protein [Methylobacterium aerolatum]|nr:hypothetical protein [Methylobacterium aerolatum]